MYLGVRAHSHTENIKEGETVDTVLLTPVAECSRRRFPTSFRDVSAQTWMISFSTQNINNYPLDMCLNMSPLHRFLQARFSRITTVIFKQTVMWSWYAHDVHVRFIIIVRRQLVLCLVSMGTLLLGKVKPLTNEPTASSTFCSAAALEGVRVSKVTHWGVTHAQTHIHTQPHACTHWRKMEICGGAHANSSCFMPFVLNKSPSLVATLWCENK